MSLPFIDFELLLNSGGSAGLAPPLYMWGDNTYGQLGDSKYPTYFSWAQLSAGNGHTLALRSDGTLWAWGKNDEGQIGDSTTVNKNTPVSIIATTSNFVAVSAGSSHSIAINSNNSLYVWGGNNYGQLGLNDLFNRSSPVQVGTSSYNQVSAGQNHSVFLGSDKTLYTTGFNGFGQLGDNATITRSSPVQISTSSWVSISAGNNHTLAISVNNTLYAWGDNTYGQTGLNESVLITRSSPTQVGTSSWNSVSAGGTHTAALDSTNNLYTFGYDYYGQLGLNRNSSTTGVVYAQVSEGSNHTLLIDLFGKLYSYGLNNAGQLGTNDTINRSSPVQIGSISWSQVFAGSSYSTGITSDGTLYLWGLNSNYQLGLTDTLNRSSPVQVSLSASFISVGAGESHTLAIETDKSLWGWGDNTYGQLGGAFNTFGTSWTKLSSGDSHTLGIRYDGTLWAWGLNSAGQLGTGLTTNRSSPVQIGSSSYTDVVAGSSHSLAIDTNGTLWGWGSNSSNQLGINSWSQIASGYSHTVLLRGDGIIFTYGLGSSGQLGTGLTTNRSSPTQIGSSLYSFVAAGNNISAGIGTDGSLYTWGTNTSGQLGLGDTVNKSAPTQVAGNWSQVALADYALAIANTGLLYSWGNNNNGQLGQGDTVNRSSPVVLGAASLSNSNAYSLFFNDTNQYLAAANSSSFNLIPGQDWTIEAWIYPTTTATGVYDVIFSSGGASNFFWGLYPVPGNAKPYLAVVNNGGGIGSLTASAPNAIILLNQWQHIALVNYGGIIKQYLNGVTPGTSATAGTYTFGSNMYIGSQNGTTRFFSGYMSNFRFVNGTAVYTGNFTPSTSPLSAITNTVLLTAQNTTIVDNSGNSVSITNGNGVNYSIFTPFSSVSPVGGIIASKISAGTHSLVTTTSNTLYAWGQNNYGQLGTNDTINRSSPVQVSGSWTLASASSTGHSLGADFTGFLYAWGLNSSGELGLTTSITQTDTLNRSSPTQVGTYFTRPQVQFDGTNYLDIGTVDTTPSSLQLGTGDFTFETWVYNTSQGANQSIFSAWGAPQPNAYQFNILASGNFTWQVYTQSSPDNSNTAIPLNTWTHIAVCRISNVATIYINGVLKDTTALTNSANGNVGDYSPQYVNIARSPFDVQQYYGYISALRIVKGTGLYTSNFTPSLTLTNISGTGYSTSLLTCQQNSFIDSSSNNLTITPINSPTIAGYSPLAIVSSFSAGAGYTTVVDTTNSLFVWGNNNVGQLGLTTPLSWTITDKNITHADNTLWVWGNNNAGQLGITTTTNRSSPVQVNGSWTSAVKTSSNTYLINSSGQLYGVGLNTSYQLGQGDTIYRSSPTQISSGNSFISVDAGDSGYALAIKTDYTLFGWGANDSYQLTTQVSLGGNNVSTPVQIIPERIQVAFNGTSQYLTTPSSPTSVFQLGTGDFTFEAWIYPTAFDTNRFIFSNWGSPSSNAYAFYIRDNGRFIWQIYTANSPDNANLQLSLNQWTHVAVCRISNSLTTYINGVLKDTTSTTNSANGNQNPIYIGADPQGGGQNYFSGSISNLRLIKGTGVYTSNFTPSAYLTAILTTSLLICQSTTFIDNSGNTNIITAVNSPTISGSATQYSYTQIGAGNNHVLAIANNGSNTAALSGWGNNLIGQISTPVTASFVMSTGSNALLTDGRLFAWGTNTSGMLGLGDTINRSSPVQVPGLYKYFASNQGFNSSFAVKMDGTLWGWGANLFNQLGQSDTLARSSPIQIGTDADWSKVFTGPGSNAIAIKQNGTLYAWGANSLGQLGLNDTVQRSSPTLVSGGSTGSWTLISAGNGCIWGIASDSTLWLIGGATGGYSPIAPYNQAYYSSPVQVGTSNFIYVGGGLSNVAAIKSDNTLWLWGSNLNGELGVNDRLNRSSPTQIAGGGNWTQVVLQIGAAGGMATKVGGTLWSWGTGYLSGRGTDASVFRSSPVQVGTSSWTQINAYGQSNATNGVLNNILYIWGANTNGDLGTNNTTSQSSPVVTTGSSLSSPVQFFASSTPIGTSSWTSVSAGTSTSLAIRSDSTIWSWGLNSVGQLGTNDTLNRSSPTQLGAGTWSNISAGPSHGMAVTTAGTLYGWGLNSSGQLGITVTTLRSSPTQVGALTSWNQISVILPSTTIGTLTDGRAYVWGSNSNGELGDSTTVNRSSPIQLGTNTYTSVYIPTLYGASSYTLVSAGASHTTFKTNYDYLYTTGLNSAGQLGATDTINRSSPVQIAATTLQFGSRSSPVQLHSGEWSNVAAGPSHSAAIDSSYRLYLWGDNSVGQLGNNSVVPNNQFVNISGSWTSIQAGNDYNMALSSSNTLYTWGLNNAGQLGQSDTVNRSSPVQVSGSYSVISAGASTAVAIDTTSLLYGWGLNSSGQLVTTDLVNRSNPTQITTTSYSQINAGAGHITALDTSYLLYAWGLNSSGQLGQNDTIARSSPVQLGSTGISYTLINTKTNNTTFFGGNGFILATGNNTAGMLGIGNTLNRSNPVQISANNATTIINPIRITSDIYNLVAAGYSHTIATKTDYTLYAWGSGVTGRLGINLTTNRSSPTQVSTTSSFSAISASKDNSAGLAIDKTLWTWGLNTVGQLGIGLTTNKSSPAQVGTEYWNEVNVGESTIVAVKDNNTLYIWGSNFSGQLGTGEFTNKSSPVQVGNVRYSTAMVAANNLAFIDFYGGLYTVGSNQFGNLGTNTTAGFYSWSQISTGLHSIATRDDGALFVWGLNNAGQLGLNDTINRSSPVQLTTNSFAQVYTGASSTYAIRGDGGLFVWGLNSTGQLGTGLTTNRSSPVQIDSNSYSQLTAGFSNTVLAIRSTTNTMYGWGYNNNFNIGDGTTINRSSPVQVSGSWNSVGTGGSHSIAIDSTNKLYTWGNNTNGQLGTTLPNVSFIMLLTNGALRSDGTLYLWGSNLAGQLGNSSTVDRSVPTLVTGSWISVGGGGGGGAGAYAVNAVSTNGTLWAWGGNSLGQLGDSTTVNKSAPIQIGSATNWRSVYGGGLNNLFAIKTDNTLWVTGGGNSGANGTNDTLNRSSPTQIGGTWLSVSNTSGTTYGIKTDYTLWAWGLNAQGQLGTNDTFNRSSPVQIAGSWTGVGSGSSHGIAIDTSNRIFTWGLNSSGQLGLNDTITRSSPVQVGTLTWPNTIVTASSSGSAFVSGGALYTMGTSWVLGQNISIARSSPVQVGTSSWSMISVSSANATLSGIILNRMYVWGINNSGALGDGSTTSRSSPVQLTAAAVSNPVNIYAASPTLLDAGSWRGVAAGDQSSMAIRNDYGLFAWGLNTSGQLGLTNINAAGDTVSRSSPVQVGTSSWVAVSAGLSSTGATRTDNTLYTWGLNANGQLGLNDTINRSSPVQVGTVGALTNSNAYSSLFNGTTQYLSIASNAAFTFGTGDFTIEFWFNGASQLNKFFYDNRGGTSATYPHITTGTTTSTLRWGPTNTNGSIIIGNNQWNHCAVTRQSGTVNLWVNGVLDTSVSDTTNYSINYNVYLGSSSFTPPANLVSGYITNFRVVKGVAVYTGTFTVPTTPLTATQSAGTNISAITTGQTSLLTAQNTTIIDNSSNSFTITNVGTVGYSYSTPFTSFIPAGSLYVSQISATSSNMGAISTTNLLYQWGINTSGQLGQNDTLARSNPVQISLAIGSSSPTILNSSSGYGNYYRSSPTQVGTSSYTYITTGYDHTIAKQSSTVFAWGRNTEGELGNSTTINRSSPVQIGALSSSVLIDAGNNYTVGISSTGGAFGIGDNTYGQLGDGS